MSRIVATPLRRALVALVAFTVALCQSGAFSALTPADSRRGGRIIAMSRAERLVDDAIEYLEELPAFSVKLDFEGEFFGKRYYGHGRYEEITTLRNAADSSLRPPLERTRFLLNASMDAEDEDDASDDITFDVVCDCDNRAWWRNDSTSENSPLSQINIEDLKNSLGRLGEEENLQLVENGVKRPCGMNGMPGLGGIAGTLKRISSYYWFEPEYQEVVSTSQSASETVPTKSFLKVVGEVKSRFWDRVRYNLGYRFESVPDYIAENLPTSVEIYFRMIDVGAGRRRPFPCKIVYYTKELSGKEETRRFLFAVEYTSILRGSASINPDDFIYVQPQITFDRYNADYVQEITEAPVEL